jgi:hypothetical protein
MDLNRLANGVIRLGVLTAGVYGLVMLAGPITTSAGIGKLAGTGVAIGAAEKFHDKIDEWVKKR